MTMTMAMAMAAMTLQRRCCECPDHGHDYGGLMTAYGTELRRYCHDLRE